MAKKLCVMCEKSFESNKKSVYFCEECENKIKFAKRIEMVDKAKHELEKKRYKCIEKYEKVDVSEYSQKVKERVFLNQDLFSSVPEIEVAIQLERIGLKYLTQKTIGTKTVDFYIPEEKIILEIDGELYHTNYKKSCQRDKEIMSILGNEWEIIHIDANEIPRYTWDLRNAFRYILEQRKKDKNEKDSCFDSIYLMEFKILNQKRSVEIGNKAVFDAD